MSYTLDFLEEKFTEHSEIYKIHLAEREKQIEENGWERSEYEDGFNLPEGFLTIIREIKKLKGA